MPHTCPRPRTPEVFDFEGVGDVARDWLDTAYGTRLRLSGRLGTVRHQRADHGIVAFDHVTIDAPVTFDADPMPALVVVDLLRGASYTRDGVTDRRRDGDTILVAGWEMPFTGSGDASRSAPRLHGGPPRDAVAEWSPRPAPRRASQSTCPTRRAAGARWRATVDELAAHFPGDAPLGRARRVLAARPHVSQTFPNDVVDPSPARASGELHDATPSTVRRALRVIGDRAEEELTSRTGGGARMTPRALQYAFRRQLGCTPQAYLRRVRLDLARQALRDGSAQSGRRRRPVRLLQPRSVRLGLPPVFDENPGQLLLVPRPEGCFALRLSGWSDHAKVGAHRLAGDHGSTINTRKPAVAPMTVALYAPLDPSRPVPPHPVPLGPAPRGQSTCRRTDAIVPDLRRSAVRPTRRADPSADETNMAVAAAWPPLRNRGIDLDDLSRGPARAHQAASASTPTPSRLPVVRRAHRRGELRRHFRDSVDGAFRHGGCRTSRPASPRPRRSSTRGWADRPDRAKSPPTSLRSTSDIVEALAADGCSTPTSMDARVADGSSSLGDLLGHEDRAPHRQRPRSCSTR